MTVMPNGVQRGRALGRRVVALPVETIGSPPTTQYGGGNADAIDRCFARPKPLLRKCASRKDRGPQQGRVAEQPETAPLRQSRRRAVATIRPECALSSARAAEAHSWRRFPASPNGLHNDLAVARAQRAGTVTTKTESRCDSFYAQAKHLATPDSSMCCTQHRFNR